MNVLTDAMNTYAPSLAQLRADGYTLHAEGGDESIDTWVATSHEVRLTASSPIALLGLAAMWRAHGPAWSTNRVDNLYDRLLDGEIVAPS